MRPVDGTRLLVGRITVSLYERCLRAMFRCPPATEIRMRDLRARVPDEAGLLAALDTAYTAAAAIAPSGLEPQYRAASTTGVFSWGTIEAARSNLAYARGDDRRIEIRYVTAPQCLASEAT